MITAMPVTQARLKFGELTNKVFNKENIFILSKSGLPIAALINMDEFNKLGLTKVEQLNALVRDIGKQAEKKGITEEKLNKMMKETRSEVYQETYGE